MPSPFVSVVMPTYNAEEFLAQAADSILQQTFSDFELIIVDDGSTDQTAKILKEYECKDSRVTTHFMRKNMGIATALNIGLSLSRGKYFARMDADDISLPERFSEQVAFLDSHSDVDVLGTAATVIDGSGRRYQDLVFPASHSLILWSLCFYCPIIHPSVMIRREKLVAAGGYSAAATHAEDYELWGRLSTTAHFANLESRLLELRKSGSNVSTRYRAEFYRAGISVSRQLFKNLTGVELPVTPFELTLQPRRTSSPDLGMVIDGITSLLDHFQAIPGITHQEQRYLRRETALRLLRLLPSSPPDRTVFNLLLIALKYDPLAFLSFPRLVLHKLISR